MAGTQNITTMGWTFNSRMRMYALVPITLAAAMTFAAILFALYHVHQSERREAKRGSNRTESIPYDGQLGRLVVPHTAIKTFDASDPIHLIVASAARRLVPGPQGAPRRRYWEQHEDSMVFFQLER
ncbi:hypothetical protein J3R83DRAFT_7222 [Lanmaoa asiatica]|nr:hypothetical protein J3R83DRAFT_7222 [Lanmaoa asiatica]